jgi:hypothetical protein
MKKTTAKPQEVKPAPVASMNHWRQKVRVIKPIKHLRVDTEIDLCFERISVVPDYVQMYPAFDTGIFASMPESDIPKYFVDAELTTPFDE